MGEWTGDPQNPVAWMSDTEKITVPEFTLGFFWS